MEIRETPVFRRWLDDLRDGHGRRKILVRIQRLAGGHAGDAKPVGGKVSELRIDTGPGYRVYFTRRGADLILLLAGGDKKSQQRDVRMAQLLALQSWE